MRESFNILDSQPSSDVRHLQTPNQPGNSSPEFQQPLVESCSQSTAFQYPSSSELFRQSVLSWLEQHVPTARLEHILRVEAMSIELAQVHGLNVTQAAQAGLMHDLAKFFKPQLLLQMAQAEGLELDPVDRANPHLLHAEVGAIVARDEFGVQDEVVLQAIRNHTLGRPGMCPVSCAVFLADSLEPGRGSTPELAVLRQVSQQNLHEAVWLTCENSLNYLLSHRQLIHPRTVITRNWSMTATKERKGKG